jgi:hypothetical protein
LVATEFMADAAGNRKRAILTVEAARERMRRTGAEFLPWEEVRDSIGSKYEADDASGSSPDNRR